jgi:hypothetical protein
MVLPPPPRLSMISVWPNSRSICAASRRENTSVPPPGA